MKFPSNLIYLSNLVWSAAYLFSKLMLREVSAIEVAFVRQLAALVVFIGIYWIIKCQQKYNRIKFKIKNIYIFGAGFFTFFLSAILQMVALNWTRAVDASLLISFEPLITVVLAVVLLKEKMTKIEWSLLGFALVGVLVLSDLQFGLVNSSISYRQLWGNLMLILAFGCEAMFSILIKKTNPKIATPSFIGGALIYGLGLQILLQLFLFKSQAFGFLFRPHSVLFWFGALYLGGLCTAVGYWLWAYALNKISVSNMALTLYVQPLFGVGWGILFLKEKLYLHTIVGGALVLSSLILSQWVKKKNKV